MKRVVKLCPHQFWSEANPEIIIEWNKSTRKPNSNERCWSVSIDTPNYSYYSRYMDLTARKNLWFTKDLCKNNLNNFYVKARYARLFQINLYNLFLHDA
ncbi:hypothetical protein ANSO36C_24200 [Nostoc cf. commune SO-36]|uniref:Uncharacterized protein n=1 Tax=Nostoc cf. commune SO-36 TaxID=449208 RepID=A0ABM7Z155_NOSCO|nr:hypothetical protein [Nostoc commune]BDI16618.1 hypothetical protein ANSO36C_24200 [Nostoc cf. commune SO-36]